MSTLIPFPDGGYAFLEGVYPYSQGVVALEGFAIERASFAHPVPMEEGFRRISRYLALQNRPKTALCAAELRSPKPFSFEGFVEFNKGYVEQLVQRGILVGDLNPVARTNVAPEVNPPAEVLLYGFSYAAPARGSRPTFVVAGAGELSGERLDARDIVRRGDVSPDGLREKASQVLSLMDQRLQGLGVGWDRVTAVEVYTVHNIFPLIQKLLLPRMGAAAAHGLRWHFTRPPIEEVEFELDVRGSARELTL